MRGKVGLAALACVVVVGGSAAAMAAGGAPKHTTINAVTSTAVKINRWLQDGTRWQNDVYHVKSGGTITIVNLSASDGAHTFSVVKKSQLPHTVNQITNCFNKICGTIANELGVIPNSNTRPKFAYAKNGKGTNTPININQPGDTASIAPFQNVSVTLKVTAKPGTTLYFFCAVHPWMEAKLIVGK